MSSLSGRHVGFVGTHLHAHGHVCAGRVALGVCRISTADVTDEHRLEEAEASSGWDP